MRSKLSDWFYSFRRGVRNLIEWGPTIWKDRDWDYIYLCYILRFKLNRMRNTLEDCRGTDSCSRVDSVKLCVDLLDRIIHEKFETAAFDALYAKWGPLKMKSTPSGDSGLHLLDIRHEKVTNEEEELRSRKDLTKVQKRVEYMQKQEFSLLFDTMKKHIRTWWH